MKYLLNTINRIKNKSIKVNRASISYNNSKHVGILYKYIDENKQKALNDFKNKIISDGIRVDFLPSIRKKNADNRYFKTFKSDEINMFGNWSNNNVNLFIYQQYDFIIYPDLYLSYDMENILIRSNAKCRVGFIENKFNLFELLIKSDKDYDIDYRLNKLYQYLKKV